MSDVTGLGDLIRAFQNLADLDQQKVVMAGAFVLEGKVEISMTEAKHGRRYGSHRASAPGEPPAVDKGTLINSIQTVPASGAALVGTHLEKAPMLEFGTARIEPRPFMRPAADNNKDEIGQAMTVTAKRLAEAAVS